MTITIHTDESYELLLADAQDELGDILDTVQAPDFKLEHTTDEVEAIHDRWGELERKVKGLRLRVTGKIDHDFLDTHDTTLIRMYRANELLRCIAGCGRRFFFHKDRVSRFELDARNQLRFRDAYSWEAILLRGTWSNQHFSEGGTLRSLVNDLAGYIRDNTKLHDRTFGPWPPMVCGGDLWGYGADMVTVRALAWSMDILKEPEEKST